MKCRVLYDTGASVCFVQSKHKILEHAGTCSDANGNLSSGGLEICLGDNSRVLLEDCEWRPHDELEITAPKILAEFEKSYSKKPSSRGSKRKRQ